MVRLLLDKPERRRILGQIENWNFGIAPNGNLAQEHSFVHQAVPDIFREDTVDGDSATLTDMAIDGYSPIITRSEWTENLIQSGASNPNDATTVKSLAICSSIFRNDVDFTRLQSKQKPKIHYTSITTNACVRLDNIARLTTEFENDISKAQEHWPQHPQVSWDKLCRIWNKYGFLWPEKLHLGYKRNYNDLMQNKGPISQDQLQQHSPQTYTIVWRTKLRPIYEFFPETHVDKKAYIADIIRHISSLVVFNGSLFKLKNMRTHQCLGRQSVADGDDEDTVVMVSDQCGTGDTNEHSLWKLRETGSSHSDTLSYVFLGTEMLLCSDRNNDSILTKQGSLSNSRYALKMDYQQDRDDCSWRINPSRYSLKTGKKAGAFHIDDVISSLVYLKDGDSVIMSQDSHYLRTDSHHFTSFSPISNSNSPMNNSSGGMLKKSPISIMSIDDRYNFSSAERSESNSTQPTCNSLSSQQLGKHSITDYRCSSITSQSMFNGTDVFMEKLGVDATRITTVDYQWKIELVNSLDNISVDTVVEHPAKHTAFTDTKPSKENHVQDTPSKQDSNTNYNVLISSIVPTRTPHPIPKESPRILTPFINKPQKSQWLDGNLKLYNLQKDSDESDVPIEIANIDLRMDSNSRYSTPVGSLKSIPSNEEIIPPLPVLSAKKLGKLPMQSFQTHHSQQHHHQSGSSPSGSSGDDSDWTASPAPSFSRSLTPVPKKEANIRDTTATPEITEAEAFKRKIQQQFEDKQEVYASIYRNIFAQSTPTSNTTSRIRYYDDEYDQPIHQGSSTGQPRSYTMTPKSRYSQPTPTSSANLTPEEYLLRKRSRETSFMLLVRQETKQQLWLRAMKQSTLSHWLQSLTSGNKRAQRQSNQPQNVIVLSTNASDDNAEGVIAPTTTSHISTGDIRLQHYSKNNRTIKKKKGFYQKNSFRRQKGIII
ncbi:Plasma membrane ATPase [Mucor velutinosus]|uniref:Plasma membrane ATPase n=1 Tax=Mucor velutinosus TaxID=708070 RepID=A0AAN7HVM9_9FUNG|nr:Plasma membrane ATPase [Mucor velutinosus]